MELRRFVPLAPLPGAVLTAVIYGLDPTYESGGYPVHQWSTLGVIAGWCLLLAGLTVVAPSLVGRWMAVIAAIAWVAGPSNPGAGEIVLYAIGFLLSALLLLVSSATFVVLRYGARGRIAAAIALGALGVAALVSFGFPQSPFVDNPAGQVWAALLLAPAFVAGGALWLWLDRPSTAALARAGQPASFARRFLAGFVSWVIFGFGTSTLAGAGAQAGPAVGSVMSVASYPVGVVLLQIMPTALWGRTLGQLAAGLRVVRVDTGLAPGWLRSIVRFTLFQSVPLVGFIYFMAWGVSVRLGIGAGVPGRLLWDRASGTAVVRVPATTPAVQPIPPPALPKPDPDVVWPSYD
ncbi:MAG TPA: RDD family protein [Candidatus Dormibacteraeota bacterium]|nr:RDD family protein [Candidatus Dormibacteraeota bacterium]